MRDGEGNQIQKHRCMAWPAPSPKPTFLEKRMTYYSEHREEIREQARAAQLLKEQRGRCAICGTDKYRKDAIDEFSWAIDHDHTTGKIRGLLCQCCNLALGAVKDNQNTLRKMVAYLKKHNSPE
jgi:Recombination endonuclease VII